MKHPLIAAAVIVLAIATMPLTAQTGQQVFQQALVAERAKGDLEEAIKLYQRAAKEAGADRALAAKALLAAARCYEKLGQDGARKLYEEIARLYADQREQATAARARLSALAAPAKKEAEGLVASQLAVPPSANRYMQFTGAQVVYLDWRTGNLMVADSGAKSGRVVLKHPGQNILSFSVAPNGKDIAVHLQDRSRVQFCVTSVRGGGCRTVFEQAVILRSQAVRGWSPDSRRFLAMIGEQDSCVMVSIVAADGSVQKLATIGPAPSAGVPLNYLKSAKYSPDGKYVAWTHENPDEDLPRNGKVHVVSADGTVEGMLVDDPASMNKFLEWTPDGRHILFLSNRDGEQGLFVQAVTDGKPTGTARLVSRIPSRVYYSSMLPDGTLVYSTTDSRNEIFMTTVDPATGAFVGGLEPLSRRPVNHRLVATWSPDGKQYAYLARAQGQGQVLAIGQADSSEERLIPFSLERTGGNNYTGLTWSRDSLYLARSWTIERISADTGASTTVMSSRRFEGRRFLGIFTAHNGSDLLVSFAEGGGGGAFPTRAGILRLDAATGQTTDLASKDSARSVVVSDDGSRVAALDGPRGGRISVKPLSGGEWKEIANLTGEGSSLDLQWMPDGKALQIVHEAAEDELTQAVLWRIPVDGGPPQKLAEPAGLGHMHRVQIHPNGRRAMFHTLVTRFELWSVRNYLPAAATSKTVPR